MSSACRNRAGGLAFGEFWEMDFRRHVTAGRLSELFGKTTLDTDKVVRTLGWRRVAEQELPLLRPDTRRYLEAYSQGVNDWLTRHRDTATESLEYSVLGLQRTGYKPEPWTPVDSLSWLKAMAWDLRSNMDEELGRAIAATKVSPARVEVLRTLLNRPGDPWWDDARTAGVKETRDDILRLALKDAEGELRARLGHDPAKWKWGDLHTLTLTNETFGDSGIGPIEWLFNRGPIKLGGGDSLVDATGSDAQDGYTVDWAPSMRMIVDLADLDRSRWINLTGESGHAFDDHYWDQAPLWARGATIPMRFRPGTIRAEAQDTMTLTPDQSSE